MCLESPYYAEQNDCNELPEWDADAHPMGDRSEGTFCSECGALTEDGRAYCDFCRVHPNSVRCAFPLRLHQIGYRPRTA